MDTESKNIYFRTGSIFKAMGRFYFRNEEIFISILKSVALNDVSADFRRQVNFSKRGRKPSRYTSQWRFSFSKDLKIYFLCFERLKFLFLFDNRKREYHTCQQGCDGRYKLCQSQAANKEHSSICRVTRYECRSLCIEDWRVKIQQGKLQSNDVVGVQDGIFNAGKMGEDFERESGENVLSTAEPRGAKKIQEPRGPKKIHEVGSKKIPESSPVQNIQEYSHVSQKISGLRRVSQKIPEFSRVQMIPESIHVSRNDPMVRSSSVGGGGNCASSCTREQIICDQQSISQMDVFVCNLMLNKCVRKCGRYTNV